MKTRIGKILAVCGVLSSFTASAYENRYSSPTQQLNVTKQVALDMAQVVKNKCVGKSVNKKENKALIYGYASALVAQGLQDNSSSGYSAVINRFPCNELL